MASSFEIVEGFGNFELFESRNILHVIESSPRNTTLEGIVQFEVISLQEIHIYVIYTCLYYRLLELLGHQFLT